MHNFKLTIEYDGTHYRGWQVQAKGERTIQGEIQDACKTIFKQKPSVIGSGRTDSGVHAKAQVANIKVNTRLDTGTIRNALNAHLPNDIAIIKVEKARANFHAQFGARSKTYRYTISNRPVHSALKRHFCLHYPYDLNLNKMRAEAKNLIGTHDFRSFQATDAARKEKDTIRTIKRITIKKMEDFVIIDIEANGFLYKMVRNIVGTLLKAGSGKLPKGEVKKILKKKNRMYAAETAKASGLSLIQVKY